MTEQQVYEIAEDHDGKYHILKQHKRHYKEIASAADHIYAEQIVVALNEKEVRDAVARNAAIHDLVEAPKQTARTVDRDRVAARPWPGEGEQQSVFLVGDDH